MDNKMVMSVRELADEFHMSLPSAYDLVKREGFPAVRVGRKILIPVADLNLWLSQESRNGCIL